MTGGTACGAQLGCGVPTRDGSCKWGVLARQEVWASPGGLGELVVGRLVKCCLLFPSGT